MSHLHREDFAAAARLAALVAGLTLLVALGIRLAVAQDARDWFGFTFPGLPNDFAEVRDIFVNNVRILATVFAAAAVVQFTRSHRARTGVERAIQRGVIWVCDGVLIAGCVFHVAFVGAALGAYGSRSLSAALPHGVLELGAFALGLALYLAGRRERLDPRRLLAAATLAALALAVAALLEVMAQ